VLSLRVTDEPWRRSTSRLVDGAGDLVNRGGPVLAAFSAGRIVRIEEVDLRSRLPVYPMSFDERLLRVARTAGTARGPAGLAASRSRGARRSLAPCWGRSSMLFRRGRGVVLAARNGGWWLHIWGQPHGALTVVRRVRPNCRLSLRVTATPTRYKLPIAHSSTLVCGGPRLRVRSDCAWRAVVCLGGAPWR